MNETLQRGAAGWPLRFGAAMVGVVVAAAVLAPVAAKHAPMEQPYREQALAGPSWEHPLGVDGAGRDVWTRFLYGARATLGIALGATAIAMVGGVVLGAVAATVRGWVDALVGHVTDFLLAFPAILLGLVVLTVLEPAPASVAVAVGVASLPVVVRQVRAAFVSEAAKDYVVAARAIGAGRWRIAVVEILPNCGRMILALMTLTLGAAVLESAGLAFLGLSGEPDVAEWGMMLREHWREIRVAPWLCVAPGAAIAWTVLGLNLLGDGLRARRR
jgi:ABC-type dipeptide/oligopeptide/nickel transport system permease subunit